ncbi:MAG: hypothetical protein AB7S77_10960 [Desulfatirhabdiaceae bacterium]
MALIKIRGFNSVNTGFSVGGKEWETLAAGCGTGLADSRVGNAPQALHNQIFRSGSGRG